MLAKKGKVRRVATKPNKMDNKNKEIASKIFKEVKGLLASAHKYNKENGFGNMMDGWRRKRQQVDISICDNTTWENGTRQVRSYTIKVEDKEIAKVLTHYDASEVFSELRSLLNELKKTRGWSGLNFMSERVELASCSWSGYEVSIIPKVCLANPTCSEYKSLMNYINKYGTNGLYPVNLDTYELFSAAMGGKRGRLWDEYGERIFLDNKPKKCARILEELRKARGSKDKMECKRGEENYIDEMERKYSEYHELECEGEKRKYLAITIKTPQGKVKYQTKIY